ncbi:hypothetical protein A9Q86_15710 [Flavobacteriales bacterium 33_180_T64]|nr:hypothetical protein A9Q86_15710 [Flavobacteriales bacterium 33_180_T64]
MIFVVLIGVILSSFLLTLLIFKKIKNKVDYVLLPYLSLSILHQLFFYLDYSGEIHTNELIWGLGNGLILLEGPLFCFYIYSLTKNSYLSKKICFINILPFLVYGIFYFYYFHNVFPNTNTQIYNGFIYINDQLSIVWLIFALAFVLTGPIYLLWFYRMLKSYDANLKQQVSNYEKMNRKWVRALFMIYITSLSIILLSYFASIMSPTIPTAVFQLSYRVIYVIGILLIAFIALKDTTIFSNIIFEEGSSKNGKRYENSKINSNKRELLNTKLIDYMSAEEPYLEPRLTLKQLSIELEMSAHILSQIINEEHSQNFYDFVNSYRVKHLKELLDDKQYKTKTLLAIALESGFNSKATFNSVFKKLTNQTPSEYIKNKK